MEHSELPNSNSYYYDSENESDEELQVALRKGLLKPGLNCIENKEEKVNNVPAMKKIFEQFKSTYPWIERLDLTVDPAPLDPELAVQMSESKDSAENNDFVREMTLYRLAQAAVLEGIEKLNDLGIKTKRPEDYFAEMSKTDDHMHKIRRKLMHEEKTLQEKEDSRKKRRLKLYGKKVQIERTLEKQKDKSEILAKIKKFRKGKTTSLDFLDTEKPNYNSDSGGMLKSKTQLKKSEKSKREMKDAKFTPYKKKKSGWKKNTAEDMDKPSKKYGKMDRSKKQQLGANARRQLKKQKAVKKNMKRKGKKNL